MNNFLGERIGTLRRERGLTQEQLGRLVGVSAQAVSKWEKGGTPDVELLPILADRFGVTIDSLFGREGGTPENMEETICRWIASGNAQKRQALDRMVWVLWQASKQIGIGDIKLPETEYMDRCEIPDGEKSGCLMGTAVMIDSGFMVGVCAKDMSFMSVFPEPEAGYAAYFSDNDDYRRLFSALAQPNCLEVLLELSSEKDRLYVPAVIAKRLGIAQEEAETAMDVLSTEVHLLQREELELADGVTTYAYSFHTYRPLIPFLYFARMMGQKDETWHILWSDRKSPWLRRPDKTEKEARRQNEKETTEK